MSHLEGYTFDHIAEPGSLHSVIEEDEPTHILARVLSIFRQLQYALGVSSPQGTDLDYLPLPNRQRRKPRLHQRETRRCRRSYVLGILKRVVVTSPVMILSMFGILHLLQVLIGRSRLFWDADRIELLPALDRTHRFDNGMFQSTTAPSQDVIPIPCHSHNDYWRPEPLFDALSWGCTSVEADVWLFDEELYVGHTISSLERDRTLRSLYVDKLVKFLDDLNSKPELVNGINGSQGVFQTAPEQSLTLLVDLKNSGRASFYVLQKHLQPLREKGYLTYWDGEQLVQRAVTVVGSGDTPFDMVLENSTYRDIFYDAPLDQLWESPRSPIAHHDPIHDLDSKVDYGKAMSIDDSDDENITTPPDLDTAALFNTSTSYYASISFSSSVGFVWRGHLSPRQMDIIRGQIRGAKRRGLKVRYWNTPSWPIALRNHIWHVLVKEGADVLSVDDLAGAARQSWNVRVHQLW